jgi:adenylate kinase
MKVQLILLGAPGSGKGTQAAKLVTDKGFKHISTGDLLRREIEKASDLGLRVKGIMERGELVDDSTVLALLQANCDLASNQYIFDGFPRNIEQAKSLDNEVLKGARTRAVYFEMDLEELVKRIINRRIAPKSGEIYNLITRPPKVAGKCDITGEDLIQRKDDNEDTVRNRLDIFKATIDPMLDYYESLGILRRVDATLSQDKVFGQVLEAIGN